MSLIDHPQAELERAMRRARFASVPPRKEKPDNLVVLVAPTSDPARDVMDFIIAAVGNALETPVNEINSGLPRPDTISARRLAIGLCVRRPRFSISDVAEHFEVSEDSVQDALTALDPILRAHVITSKTPLELTLPIIVKEWRQKAELTRRRPSIHEVQCAICLAFDVTLEDMLSSRRHLKILMPRLAAMALSKKLTTLSLPAIGRQFADRDHTTVLNGVRRMEPIIAAVSLRVPITADVQEWANQMHGELESESTPLGEGKRRY